MAEVIPALDDVGIDADLAIMPSDLDIHLIAPANQCTQITTMST